MNSRVISRHAIAAGGAAAILIYILCLVSCKQPIIERIIEIPQPEEVKPEPITLTVTPAAGGKITAVPQKDSYSPNDYVTITAVPDEGFEFVSWRGTVESIQNPLFLKMDSPKNLTPIFKKINTKVLILDIETGGKVTIEPKKDFYFPGDIVKLTAVPDPGYEFTSWTGTAAGSLTTLILTMNADQIIHPVFTRIKMYTLLLDSDPGGTVTNSAGSKRAYTAGEKCNLEAAAETGYRFDGWEGDITSKSNRIYITFDKDYQIYARFSKIPAGNTYTISAAAAGTGNVICTPMKNEYYENEKVRIRAVPGNGYMFTGWTEYPDIQENEIEITVTKDVHVQAEFMQRQWTYILYMAADNDLESAAIQDINELEGIRLQGKPVSILVLLDRAEGYDGTNGNWTDTRLFEIRTDPNGVNGSIISRRLDCPELDLTANTETELNMADPNTLRNLLTYTKGAYTADNYGLIIWGHGTGWRGQTEAVQTQGASGRAIAIDEYTNSYMTISQLHSGIGGMKLSVIGFDTCFGALLEVVYELRSDAEWFIGSEGITPSNGWDYMQVFQEYLTGALTAERFADSAIYMFKNQYAGIPGSTISKINLTKIQRLRESFDDFAAAAADCIKNEDARNKMRNVLFSDTDSYSYTNYPCDMYIDIYSAVEKILEKAPLLTSDTALRQNLTAAGFQVESLLKEAIPASWDHGKSDTYRLGIHLIPLVSQTVPAAQHSAAYIKGNNIPNQNSFITDSTGWVPNKIPEGSLLDKLFYTVF